MSGRGVEPPAQRRGRTSDPPPRAAPFIVLFVAALMLFNFPLLLIWDQPLTVLGLPLLGVALFVIWGGLILALALVSEKRGGERGGEKRTGAKSGGSARPPGNRPGTPDSGENQRPRR